MLQCAVKVLLKQNVSNFLTTLRWVQPLPLFIHICKQVPCFQKVWWTSEALATDKSTVVWFIASQYKKWLARFVEQSINVFALIFSVLFIMLPKTVHIWIEYIARSSGWLQNINFSPVVTGATNQLSIASYENRTIFAVDNTMSSKKHFD